MKAQKTQNQTGLYRIIRADDFHIIDVGYSKKLNPSFLKLLHTRKRIFDDSESTSFLIDILPMEDMSMAVEERGRWEKIFLNDEKISFEELQKWKPFICYGDALSQTTSFRNLLDNLQQKNIENLEIAEMKKALWLSEESEWKIRKAVCNFVNQKYL